jgi:hypothetical protein
MNFPQILQDMSFSKILKAMRDIAAACDRDTNQLARLCTRTETGSYLYHTGLTADKMKQEGAFSIGAAAIGVGAQAARFLFPQFPPDLMKVIGEQGASAVNGFGTSFCRAGQAPADAASKISYSKLSTQPRDPNKMYQEAKQASDAFAQFMSGLARGG